MLSPETEGEKKYANWHPPVPENPQRVESQPEAIQTEVTADELLQNIGGGWDEKTVMTGVTKESTQKLLKDVYQMFDDEYAKRDTEDNSAKLDNLEKLIHLLRAKKTEPAAATVEGSLDSSARVEAVPDSGVEAAAEVSAEQPGETEEPPKDNVIDKAAEFEARTQMNDALKSTRNLAFEMYGGNSALTQGHKILGGVQEAFKSVRAQMAKLNSNGSMNSDIAATLSVLRGGIDNQRKGQQRDINLDQALDEVDKFIAELKTGQASAESTATKDRAA